MLLDINLGILCCSISFFKSAVTYCTPFMIPTGFLIVTSSANFNVIAYFNSQKIK